MTSNDASGVASICYPDQFINDGINLMSFYVFL